MIDSGNDNSRLPTHSDNGQLWAAKVTAAADLRFSCDPDNVRVAVKLTLNLNI